MKSRILRILTILGLALGSATGLMAQNSLPAPGSGGTYNPSPVGGGNVPGPGPGPGAGAGPGWGGPMGAGWNGGPVVGLYPAYSSPVWSNSGTTNVVGCGYDAQGIWRVVPMTAAYTYNGIQYNVTILNAWDPWTRMWNNGVDVQAFNTSYYLKGTWYNFYVVLSTGTYYFNL